MPTYQDEQMFKSEVVGNDLLDNAISWIKASLHPDEVFDLSDLEAWAEDNGWTRVEE